MFFAPVRILGLKGTTVRILGQKDPNVRIRGAKMLAFVRKC